jgi:PAS domain S-box-containing protein
MMEIAPSIVVLVAVLVAGLIGISVALGLTSRARLQDGRALRTSNKRLRVLEKAFEEAGHAIFITDRDGRIQFVNPAFTRITGYEESEAVGQTPRILKSGEQPPEYYERLWECLLRGDLWHEDIVNRTKDNARYYADQTIAPITNDEGEIERFVAIQTDITARRIVEERLAEQERQYRLLAEHATDMISRHAPDGTYRYVSPAARDLTGYEPEELVGRNPYEIFDPRDLPAIQESHQRIVERPEDSVISYRIVRKDGSHLWCETTSTAVRDAETGDVTEIIAVTRNVEERKRIEERLREAKAGAETANRAKGLFLANMSHEIRTPLNAILGYGDIILERTGDEDIRYYADLIKSSGTSLLHLLNDVLDLSKVESGKMEIARTPVGIMDIIETTISMFRAQAAQKGVTLLSSTDGEPPAALLLDAARLRQVLVNLIGNAVKFTSEGSVEVHTSFREAARGVDLRITVTDTGIGIPSERIDSIFEAFVQSDPAIHEKYGGTGLGLAITKRLAGLLGGGIQVDSEPGTGSTFTVDLPGVPVAAGPDSRAWSELAGAPTRDDRGDAGSISHVTAGTQHDPALQDSAEAILRVRATIGEEKLEAWKRLFRVKVIDGIAEMAREVSVIAREEGAAATAGLAEELVAAAGRFDVSRIEGLAPLLQLRLYGSGAKQ